MTRPTGSVERPDPLREPIVISRARLRGPVTARSVLQWRRAHTLSSELLQLIGFVPVTDGSATVLVLPAHVPGHEQRLKAATAAATLRAIGHPVRLARQLEDPQAVPQLSQPLLGSALRQQLGQGGDLGRPWGDGHSDDVARTLLELSAPSSGILAVAAETLREAEWWWWGAEHPVDHMPATQRLAELAEQLHAVAGEISRLRADLALMDRRRDESGQTPPHRNPSVAATAAAAAAAARPSSRSGGQRRR